MKKRILSLLLSMTAGFDTPVEDTTEGETQEAVTLPTITIPDPTDDRAPTDTAEYAERVESLFATIPPVPASDLTYEITEDGVTVTGYNGKDPVTVRALNEFLPEALTRARATAGSK